MCISNVATSLVSKIGLMAIFDIQQLKSANLKIQYDYTHSDAVPDLPSDIFHDVILILF